MRWEMGLPKVLEPSERALVQGGGDDYGRPVLHQSGGSQLAPADRGSDVGQDGLDDVGVVGDAELVRDREE